MIDVEKHLEDLRARLAESDPWSWRGVSVVACRHCLGDPPRGHVCPNCGRAA